MIDRDRMKNNTKRYEREKVKKVKNWGKIQIDKGK